jgi:PAS domain S-box-containing protein
MIAADAEISAFPDPKAWLAAIVESSDDAIVGKRLDGTIVSWNDGAQRMFGYTAAEILGESVLKLFPPELRDEEPEIIRRLSRGERVDHYETIRVRKDGTRINVSLSVSPIRDEMGLVVGAAKIARDITQQKHIEARLTELNAELQRQVAAARAAQEQAEKASQAKTEFLRIMSHELRTPLNAISGYTDLIETGVAGQLPATYADYLGRIKANQVHLLQMINTLLDLSRVEGRNVQLRSEAIPVAELFSRVETMTAPQASAKGHAFQIRTPPDDLAVIGDAERVLQVLLNLVSNAVKFTPDGGTISLEARAAGNNAAISVTDTGPGVAAADRDRIFEPFVQVDRSLSRGHEGAGLGLAISRDLARAMHGDIMLHESASGGASFTLLLPRRT